MNGQLYGLLAIADGFAALIGGVVLLGRRRNARRDAFLQFCEQRHYTLGEWNEKDDQGYTLSADGWTMTVQRTRSSSGDWKSEAVFLCERTDEERLCFALQYTAGNTAVEDLPVPVRTFALAALRNMLRESAGDLESIRTAFLERGRACVVMEPTKSSAERAIERLRPELRAWRGRAPVYVESGPERVRVRFMDCYIKAPEQIEAVVRIGLAALDERPL